jgi:predicted permease
MISLGVSLKAGTIKQRYASLGSVAAIKLLLLPLVALGVGSLVLGDTEAVRLGVMQAGMPAMMLSLVFGIRYRLDVDFIASAILVTTVGAILAVPAFQILIG